MSRDSRFSRIETEREAPDGPAPSGASLDRFGVEADLVPQAPPPDPMAPVEGAARLNRFDADGADGLGVDRDPLALLPTLQCVACGAECGKFEPNCHRCRAPLTTPEVRAHNLGRVEVLKAEAAAALESRHKAQAAEAEAHAEILRAKAAAEAAYEEAHSGLLTRSGITAGPRIALIGLAVLFAALTHGALRGAGILVALVAGLTLLPARVWIALGRNARFRDRD